MLFGALRNEREPTFALCRRRGYGYAAVAVRRYRGGTHGSFHAEHIQQVIYVEDYSRIAHRYYLLEVEGEQHSEDVGKGAALPFGQSIRIGGSRCLSGQNPLYYLHERGIFQKGEYIVDRLGDVGGVHRHIHLAQLNVVYPVYGEVYPAVHVYNARLHGEVAHRELVYHQLHKFAVLLLGGAVGIGYAVGEVQGSVHIHAGKLCNAALGAVYFKLRAVSLAAEERAYVYAVEGVEDIIERKPYEGVVFGEALFRISGKAGGSAAACAHAYVLEAEQSRAVYSEFAVEGYRVFLHGKVYAEQVEHYGVLYLPYGYDGLAEDVEHGEYAVAAEDGFEQVCGERGIAFAGRGSFKSCRLSHGNHGFARALRRELIHKLRDGIDLRL